MHFIEVLIPVPLNPLDRGNLFEEPFEDALEAEGIEYEWLGSGTGTDGCDFSFEVADLKRALVLLFKILKDGEAPPDTTIRAVDSGDKATTYRLGDLT